MKKIFIFLLTSTLFLSFFTYCFAAEPKELSLHIYNNDSIEKNGRQYRQGAFEEHDGHVYLMLQGNASELSHAQDIHRGMPVIASFDGNDYALFVDHVHIEPTGNMLICLDTDEITAEEEHANFDLNLKFYSDDLSTALYSANIKNVPAKDSPMIPQTGDGAVLFILAAVVCLIFMAFLLAPKKDKIQ